MRATRFWPAIIALGMGGFTIGTTEFVTMGVLPQIAEGVDVSIPVAGGVISAYALGVVVGAPVMAFFGAKLPRRGLLVALMVQYTLRNRILHIVFWSNFAITVVATLYFGWHYIADDLAGVVIALFSFWLGGLASGQKFDRRGLSSHPTSTTSQVPVDAD